MCGTRFRTPRETFEKVYVPMMDKATGREMPTEWFCDTKQSRLNGISSYRTPHRMTQFDAACYFERELNGKSIQGNNAVGTLTNGANMYRRQEMREALGLCRKCYRGSRPGNKPPLVDILTIKKGVKRSAVLNPPKPIAVKRASKPKKVEEVQYWYCSTPSTRDEPSRTAKTPRAMTEHEAREWFRFHFSRLNLSGCNLTGTIA